MPPSHYGSAGRSPLRNLVIALGLFCLVAVASGADQPAVDADTRAFAQYVSDASRLNGMFRGVADYCKQFVPALILDQSEVDWRKNNGQYIDAIDVAIERFASRRVEPARKAQVIEQLRANAHDWFQAAHDKSNVLDQVQGAENKNIACSRMLGTMVSESFYLKKMFPADDEYWAKYLEP
jgi:hypothetical protein